MLPPPPSSRQASYAYTLPRSSSSRHPRTPTSDEVEDDAADFEEGLDIEADLERVEEERGLEETLEKLGFGMCP